MKSFLLQITWRIAILTAVVAAGTVWALRGETPVLAGIITLGVVVVLGASLYRYTTETNRRLSRFFESVRYSDFAVRFSSGETKGESFGDLNKQFNEVLEAFRQARAEKEANLLFLNAVVQHLTTGILAFDAANNLLVSNNTAFQLLGVYRVNNLRDLPSDHRLLVEFAENLRSKGKMLYQPDSGRQISVQGVALNLQGRNVRLITLQNIHPELQRKELDAWRNLTRVLRHEIMNSVTPIVTIVDTMKEIVHTDLKHTGATADLEEALDIVATRSRSLMDFVEAYRSFSSVPPPKLETFPVKKIVDHVATLVASDLKKSDIAFTVEPFPEDLQVTADPGQTEMVLLNLIKNACESLTGENPVTSPAIRLQAGADARGNVSITVSDNGHGVPPDLIEEIFIPFFTTKVTGTGIGLSISKQIMQQQGGDIRVVSSAEQGAMFVMQFGG